MKTLILALGLAAASAGAAWAAGISVQGGVIRAVAAGVPNTAGYMTLVNAGAEDDRLVSASCACAAKVEAHLSHVMDGSAMMMPAGLVTIPARGSKVFAPGGYHLMITGLKASLKDGSTQTVVFKFQKAGTVTASFQVQSKIPLQ